MNYYKITARNAWDNVPIGLFKSYAEAKACLEIGWSEKLIKPATQLEIDNFLNKKP